MNANRSIRRMVIAVFAVSTVCVVATFGAHDAWPVAATHDGYFVNHYFAGPFIEDIPNTPSAFIRVADCSGGASHATLIQGAIARWNATNQVRYVYDTQNPTVACDTSGGASQGFPLVDGVISVLDAAVSTGDFTPITLAGSSLDDDWGPENVASPPPDNDGMYPMRVGRVRLGPSYQTVEGLTHELGHGAGLADRYLPDEPCAPSCPPCAPYTTVTVMDCSTDDNPIPSGDTGNLNALYNRIPQPIPIGPSDWRTTSATYNSISFAWTDYSFNERYQYIGKSTGGFPLAFPRDAQSATWNGLAANTNYCFHIAQANAYGGTAANSPDVCATTLPSGFDLQGSAYSTTTLAPNEGASQTFTLTVKNNGGQVSPASYAAVRFNGNLPSTGGICFIPSVPAKVGSTPGTASCTTASTTWNFGGGPISVEADYGNAVSEFNESNNILSTGATLAVKPSAPTAVFVSPPFAAYGYTDHSAIETGFGVTMKKRAGGCGSSGFNSFSITPNLNAPLSGNSTAIVIAPWSPDSTGYCYRVTVTALGPYANATAVTGPDVNYP